MSDKFNGFSQEEINKVTGVKNKRATFVGVSGDVNAPKQSQRNVNHLGIRRVTDKIVGTTFDKQKKSKSLDAGATAATATDKSLQKSVTTTVTKDDLDDFMSKEVNLNRSLSRSIEEALFYQPFKMQQQQKQKYQEDIEKTIDNNDNQKTDKLQNDNSIMKMHTIQSKNNNNNNNNNNISNVSSNDSGGSILHIDNVERHQLVAECLKPIDLNLNSPFKGISLSDFEAQRKMIEEQNRQKKELLRKAIEQHSIKTAQETRKIEEIKGELAKLETDIAVDVAILRKQIDDASIQFSNIEKQYIKIESQFLKAKVDLHNAAEKKELLTEHLCTVIAHNEDRKAQRLSELMEKVGLSPVGEYQRSTTPTDNENSNNNSNEGN